MLRQRYIRATSLMLMVLLAAPAAWAQSLPSPLSNVVLAGYGSATYSGVINDDFTNNFTASVSPVILYSMGNDLLFETELEFGLSGEATTTSLEYAQIDYLGFERVQFIAGKFLLPFGLFSERLHPTWVNKMPTSPLLYGHGHGGVAEGALLPVLSDAGFMMRMKQPLSTAWAFDLSVWVSQGPRLVTEAESGDDHADDHGVAASKNSDGAFGILDDGHRDEAKIDIPTVGFGVAFADNNENKMIGGRLGLVHGPGFEIYVSGFHAMYDPENFLDIAGGNLAIDWRRGALDVRAEGTLLWQEFEHEEHYETLQSSGYYVQVARRVGAFEPVVRWSHLLEADVDSAVARPERRQLALGLNYWIDASIPVKVAYEIDLDGTDGFFLQWAFGF